MTGFKSRQTGEIVIPSPGSDYEKRLADDDEWEELSPEQLKEVAVGIR